MKDLKKKLPYLTEVKNAKQLDELKPLTTYTTRNYGLFKILEVNRGAKNGIDPKRVKKFNDAINNEKYAIEDCHVKVNKNLEIFDGTHKFSEAVERGWYVNFMIVPDKMFNDVDQRTLANNVCIYNAIDSSWRDGSNFNSAFKANEPCAVGINNLIQLAVSRKVLRKSSLSPTRIIGIIENFEKNKVKVAKQLREVYCNDAYAEIINSSEFQEKFTNILTFLETLYLGNSKVRGYAVVQLISIELSRFTKYPDWVKLNENLKTVIRKDVKRFEKYGDCKADFVDIAEKVIKIK